MRDSSLDTNVVPPRRPRAGRALALAQVVRFMLRLGTAMALARMLGPDAYGVFGMAAVVYGFFYLIRDFGVGIAVQQPNLDARKFATLCRFGLVGGIGVGLVCAASAPLAAWFYHESRLTALLAALAISFPCSGAAAPRVALLYRTDRAATAALIDTVALAASCVAALIAAGLGAQAWALVAFAIVTEVFTLGAAVIAGPLPPPGENDASEFRWSSFAGFGAGVSAAQIANYFGRTCDQAIVGRFRGTAELGIYGRGVQATALPVQFTVAPFTTWIVSVLAQSHDRADEYRAFFRSALNGLSHLTLPIAAVCVAVPQPLVVVLFGAKWLGAVPVVRWLGITLGLQPLLFTPMWLLLSTGQPRRLAILSAASFVVMLAFVLPVRFRGLEAIALGTAAGTVLAMVGSLAFSVSATVARWRDVGGAIWRPLLLAVGLAAICGVVERNTSAVPACVAGCAVAAAGYAAIVAGVWPGARREWMNHVLWHR